MTNHTFQFQNPDTGLKMTAKHFILSGCQDGLTLLFAHAIGSHKEQWEPVLEELLKIQGSTNILREAWTFDWQSHGEAAVLNETVLKERRYISPKNWGEDLGRFLCSSHLSGRRAVAIGHSGGASAWCLAMARLPGDIPLAALVMIEAGMMTRHVYDTICKPRMELVHMMPNITRKQRDSWPNRSVARAWLSDRMPWKTWDPRTLDLYVIHGLYNSSASTKNPRIAGAVRVKCDKTQEAAAYTVDDHLAAADQLSVICPLIPVHAIFGMHPGVIPKYAQESICDGLEGRKMASVVHVPDVGHMMIQENPTVSAKALFSILETLPDVPIKSKL